MDHNTAGIQSTIPEHNTVFSAVVKEPAPSPTGDGRLGTEAPETTQRLEAEADPLPFYEEHLEFVLSAAIGSIIMSCCLLFHLLLLLKK